MNDHFGSPVDPDDEQLLDEALARLRRIEPPIEARIANRLAVSTALEASTIVPSPQRPWWQRTVAVPMPLAASVLLALGLALGFGLQNRNSQSPVEIPNERQVAPGSNDARPGNAPPGVVAPSSVARAIDGAGADSSVRYYAAETYLCGVGRIHSESRYLNKEQKP